MTARNSSNGQSSFVSLLLLITALLVLGGTITGMYRSHTEPLKIDFKDEAQCAFVELLDNDHQIFAQEAKELLPYVGQKKVQLIVYQLPKEDCEHLLVAYFNDEIVIDHRAR